MALVQGSDVESEMGKGDPRDNENEEVEDMDDFQNYSTLSDLNEVQGIMEVTNMETPYLLAPKWPLFEYLKKRDDMYEKTLKQVVSLLSHKRIVNSYFEKLQDKLKIVKKERSHAQTTALLNHNGAMLYLKQLMKARKSLARSQKAVLRVRRQLISGKKLIKKAQRNMQLMRRSVMQAYEVSARVHGMKSASASTSRTA